MFAFFLTYIGLFQESGDASAIKKTLRLGEAGSSTSTTTDPSLTIHPVAGSSVGSSATSSSTSASSSTSSAAAFSSAVSGLSGRGGGRGGSSSRGSH